MHRKNQKNPKIQNSQLVNYSEMKECVDVLC